MFMTKFVLTRTPTQTTPLLSQVPRNSSCPVLKVAFSGRCLLSIIPLEILVNAQKEGNDVDSLKMLSEHNMETVYDASNNLMTLLGVVQIPVALEGGRTEKLAFHISERKDCEILLGTNALRKLGVKITITSESERDELSLSCCNVQHTKGSI
ncbi:hypothetical protein ANCDUO_06177 [Ancylostoma duodenale]|uniref:Uncharacterized protein n=1 Tax=Ancylostoma duodenale TaxID=51022 RepID=A0A0C2GQC7_9BILA|nr:hypothetical protein ANCDUO_06177 [Ancylostoma duodenale]